MGERGLLLCLSARVDLSARNSVVVDANSTAPFINLSSRNRAKSPPVNCTAIDETSVSYINHLIGKLVE